MRIPATWDDKELLNDEPFCTKFRAFSAADTSRRNTSAIMNNLHLLAAELGNDVEDAAREWLRLAFTSSPLESRHDVSLDRETRLVFILFYWKLYNQVTSNTNDPIQFLRQQRTKRGFQYPLPDPLGAGVSDSTPGEHGQENSIRVTKVMEVTQKQTAIKKRGSKRSHNRAGFEGSAPLALALNTSHKDRAKQDIPRSQSVPPVLKAHSRSPNTPRRQNPASHREEVTRITIGNTPIARKLRLHNASNTRVSSSGQIHQKYPQPRHQFSQLPGQGLTDHGKDCSNINLDHPSYVPQKACAEVTDKAQLYQQTSNLLQPNRLLSATPLKTTTSMEISQCTINNSNNGLNSTFRSTLPDTNDRTITDISPKTNVMGCVDTPQPILCLSETFGGVRTYLGQQNSPLRRVAVSPQKKPPLLRYPPLWAQSRQEICESFDWFRSYQGGVYHVQDFVKGYLLSAFSSSRDVFEHDGRLIVSHGGGKSESIHSHQGKSILLPAEDQSAQDKSVRALLTNYRESRPLVLLIDDKYALFPYDIGAKDLVYAVLGLYTISHAWAEYQPANNIQGRVVRYKFAFQWCEGQGEPWWLSPEDITPKASVPLNNTPITTTATSSDSRRPAKVKQAKLLDNVPMSASGIYFPCGFCKRKSPKVFKQAWACLNPSCAHFWITAYGTDLSSELDYDPDFLQLSIPHMLPANLRDLRPTLPAPGDINTTYPFTRGLHCRKCGRLSCRFKWEHWECSYCKQTTNAPGRLRLAEEFWNEKLPVSFMNYYVHGHSGIMTKAPRLFPHGNGVGQVQTFLLPNNSGCIHHIQSTTTDGSEEADVIFKVYQEHAKTGQLEFRRWPIRTHKCRGALLTNYFSQNSGEPYHYVGGTANTVPFENTSVAVIKARNLIQTRIHQALNKSADFNEVLSAAYMERQRMAFHSDSEQGLGPLVAGLSLGSPAIMHFRMHSKYVAGTSGKKSKIALSIVLRHGDVLVMDGAGVQENYEHVFGF